MEKEIEVPAVIVRCERNEYYEDRIVVGNCYAVIDVVYASLYTIVNELEEVDNIPKELFTVVR